MGVITNTNKITREVDVLIGRVEKLEIFIIAGTLIILRDQDITCYTTRIIYPDTVPGPRGILQIVSIIGHTRDHPLCCDHIPVQWTCIICLGVLHELDIVDRYGLHERDRENTTLGCPTST